VWSRSGKHGRLGSLKVVSVVCVFEPSLFGYNIICSRVKNSQNNYLNEHEHSLKLQCFCMFEKS